MGWGWRGYAGGKALDGCTGFKLFMFNGLQTENGWRGVEGGLGGGGSGPVGGGGGGVAAVTVFLPSLKTAYVTDIPELVNAYLTAGH